MATINELQDEVVEEFQDFSDWMDKYQMLIDLGNEFALHLFTCGDPDFNKNG